MAAGVRTEGCLESSPPETTERYQDALRLLAQLLSTAYIRLLAESLQDGQNPLDSLEEQSDELSETPVVGGRCA